MQALKEIGAFTVSPYGLMSEETQVNGKVSVDHTVDKIKFMAYVLLELNQLFVLLGILGDRTCDQPSK